MSAAFTTDKANQEFELKFTAPAGLLLNVPAPIANKNALYHQLGTNLAAARRETHLTLSGSSTSSSPQRRCLRGLCALHIRIHRRSAP